MKEATKRNGNRKRASRGSGTLYKRDNKGKEHPADWRGAGSFWLAYTIPSPDGGKGERVRAILRDEHGNAITDRDQAEKERQRVLAPFQAGNKVDTLKAIVSRLDDAEIQRAQAVDEANPPLRIRDAGPAYKSSPNRPDSGKRTLAGYLNQWQRFATWMKKHHPKTTYMRDVDSKQVRGYVADMGTLSPSTFNQHLDTLRRFWSVLHEDARTTCNPWESVKKRTLASVERRHRVLSMDEATAIIDAADGELKDLLAVIALTGQRLIDAVKLKWSSVDLEQGVISLIPTKTRRRNGKTVFIPILPQTRAILEARPHKGPLVFSEMAELFDRDRGSTLTKRIRKAVEDAGLDPHEEGTGFIETTDEDGNQVKEHSGKRAIVRVSAHSLRHTFTTIARAAGIPDAIVRSIVGHTTASMTEHYTAFDKAIVKELSSRFEALPAGQYQLEAHTGPEREPLPAWARELVTKLPDSEIKTELLKGGVE